MLNDDAPLIVGLSSRVPGARKNNQMWSILAEGRCTVSRIDDRLFWNGRYADSQKSRRGKTYSWSAGQLSGLYLFDAGFFGISPREAEQMDPQQRLMLQSVWEAVEDAGLNIADLAGERTGVFVGSSLVENLTLAYADTARAGSTFSLGNTLCIIANRVSSVFDFRGPSLVLDAACASSLYAFHLAAAALRRGELDTAIVGGVHVARSPGGYVGFSQARMLSLTGLCRAFDADADGYVRSEASVALVLQRPDVAERMGARQRARVLATGVNTDGGTSQLAVPSGLQQTLLIEKVVADSTVDPEDFFFFEAHGTGTQVGDPVEAGSIGSALATLRRNPLPIGSSKTNFGHSEPAAGLVSMAKTLLAFENCALPASLHFRSPNPNIDFEKLNILVNTKLTSLPEEAPVFAGINSFGFGGTNVSVVLESLRSGSKTTKKRSSKENSQEVTPHVHPDDKRWLLISAASETSLRALASSWSNLLSATSPAEWLQYAAIASKRASLTERIAIAVDAKTPQVLKAFAGGEAPTSLICGQKRFHKAQTVFAFPGNGTQITGMGRAEYHRNTLFRNHFNRIATAFSSVTDIDLISLLEDDHLEDKLSSPLIAQPILFAYQISYAHSLHESGFRPDAVVGHSVGEIAALHFAGCFNLSDAVHIIVSRSRAFEEMRGSGSMAVVAATPADVERAIASLPEADLVVAAVNSPRAVTVSGPVEALARLRRVTIENKRLAMVPLNVEIPYHSPLVEKLRDRFMADLQDLHFSNPNIPVASTVLGRMLRKRECDARYLWRNVRDQVRFSDALTTLADQSPVNLVEISPVSSFTGNVRDLTRHKGLAIEYFSSLAKGDIDPDFKVTTALAWVQGLHIDESALAGKDRRVSESLPAYPWDEKEYFNPLTDDGLDPWGESGKRLLIGLRAERSTAVWMLDVTPTAPAWIADHKVGDEAVIPATALIEMALDAGSELWPDAVIQLRDFDIVAPATVTGEGIRLRTTVDEASGGLTISQRPRLTQAEWTLVARGTLRKESGKAPKRRIQPPGYEPVDATSLYDFMAGRGLAYGKPFRRLAGARSMGRRTLWVTLTSPVETSGFLLDPMSFDAALHGLALLIRDTSIPELKALLSDSRRACSLIPVRVGELRLWQQETRVCAARLRVTRIRRHSLVLDVTLLDARGGVVSNATGVEFSLVETSAASRIPRMRTGHRRVKLRARNCPVILPRAWPMKLAKQLGFIEKADLETAVAPDMSRDSGTLAMAMAELRSALASKDGSEITALRQVLTMAPELACDLQAIMLSSNGQEARDTLMHGHVHRQIWTEAETIIEKLAKGWNPHQRLNLLISGIPDPAVMRRVLTNPRIDRIRLTLPGDGQGSLLRAVLPTELRPLIVAEAEKGSADVILSTDAKQADTKALAPGGLALRLEAPDFLSGGGNPIGEAAWYRVSGRLILRLSSLRKSPDTDAAQPSAFAPTPASTLDQLLPPAGLGLEALITGEETTHRLLVLLPQPGEDLAAFLTNLLGQVRKHAGASETPLILVCFVDKCERYSEAIIAALASVLRTVSNEMPYAPCGLVAVDGDALPQGLGWAELIDMALKDDVVIVRPDGLQTLVYEPIVVPEPHGSAAHLLQNVPGRFGELRWDRRKRRSPGEGEVEIAVSGSGLNFRDVMSARGLLPERILDLGATNAALGMECGGVVTRIGKGNSKFSPGDRVIALGASAFSTHLVLPQEAVVPAPGGIDLVTAAAIPVAFLTAWHALVDIAHISAGDSVLIHGAAGGVGLAAIQVARLYGARVFATASTPEKRAIAMAYGAETVFNSRDTDFAADVRKATNGQGITIVLNSLSGEAMQRSVECLAPFGTFIELGKRDYLEGTRLDLRPFLHNLSYHGVDLDQFISRSPEATNRTMREIVDVIESHRLRPLPVTVFDSAGTADAFQYMLSSRHTGKIVITPPELRRIPRARPITDDWVILGGTGGLGLAIGQMLLEEGASHVHLLSRSGEIALDNLKAGHWTMSEPRVSLHAVDAADSGQLSLFLDRLESEGRIIGGVIHSAMMLRDRVLSEIDTFEAGQVIRAKLGVALALDSVLRARSRQPDQVIFFSSIAAQFGNVGQVAYSAANAAVEAIAAARRRDGLAGLAIGWGPIRDAGYLAHDAVTTAQLSRLNGIAFLSVQEVLTELRKAINLKPVTDYCYSAVSWEDIPQYLPALTRPAHRNLVPEGNASQKSRGELVEILQSLSWGAALKLIRQEIREMLGAIMRIPPEQFELDKLLAAHGIDSLMALEMRLEIEERFQIQMPISVVSRDITGAKLAVTLLNQIRDESID
ncbi:type I polyketide synthase [Paracoccus sp. (in: a-proteobacteria)]|uniref:type I polyketide synthase n=1 Tax=Paracoccus sp. TaxID=267 RepID=UPI0028B0CF48|nr:type I polyketide synthase [Paracoccus sp. (in: a-proteobacteria)]